MFGHGLLVSQDFPSEFNSTQLAQHTWGIGSKHSACLATMFLLSRNATLGNAELSELMQHLSNARILLRGRLHT